MISIRIPLLALASVALMPATGLTAPQAPLPEDLGALNPMVRARIEEAWQTLDANPENPKVWLDLAQVYHAHELTGLAEACYREATRLDTENPKIWYQWALAQADVGEVEAAQQSLTEVLALTQDYAPAYWRRGRWLLEQGFQAEAEAAFLQATRVDPEDLAGWVGLARVLLERGENQQAIEILFEVLAADPANGVAGQLLGNAFRAAGDAEAARRALSMATGMGAYFPDPWQEEMLAQATGVGNRLRLLSARLDRGEVDDVVADLERLLQDHPRDIGVLNKLSEGYLHRGDAEAALVVLETAYEIDPQEFATLMHLAQAEKVGANPEAALQWVDRAIQSNPGHWQARFERAGILGLMGRYADSLVAIETAMQLGATQNPNAWLMQGDIQLRQSLWTRAKETFEQATLRFPFLGPAFLGLAVACAELGEMTDARQALEEARRLNQDPGSIAAIQQRIEAAAGRGGRS